MPALPVADSDVYVMSTSQFRQLAKIIATSGQGGGWSPLSAGTGLQGNALGYPGAVDMVRQIDDANEWLKDNTYLDMMGWKDVVLNVGMASE